MKRPHTGFTLIELMTALTVVALLLAMAVPSFREFTRNNRATAAHNDLVTAFTLARSESLKRGTPVSVCASTNGSTCSGATNWAVGWIVFSDGNGTAGAVNAPDELLQAWPGINGDIAIGGTAAFVQYTPTGTISPAAAVTFDVYPTGCAGANLRRLGVSAIGSLTATTQNCP